jgi:hypothetical protein
MAVLYILWYIFLNLVCLDQEKSGKPDRGETDFRRKKVEMELKITVRSVLLLRNCALVMSETNHSEQKPFFADTRIHSGYRGPML